MAKKKRLDGHYSPRDRWRWVDKLSAKERQVVEEETREWLKGGYPGLTSVRQLHQAMVSAGVLSENTSVEAFRKWLQEFRRG